MPDPIVPIPQVDLSVREAALADMPFIDALQKRHGRALGYFPTKQLEGYVTAGHVLIAEEETRRQGEGETRGQEECDPSPCPRVSSSPCRLGYLISKDRYLKRDELGVVYQLCVAPGGRRGLVGATLVRAAFERSAYGCRLYCCWCAQDLEANRFWESLGFVPLAFRAGGARKQKGGRVHIFWQRRIVDGDATTPWWYPFQTTGGAMRADRVVLPIPPGVHWSEVRAPEVKDEGGGQKAERMRRPGRSLSSARRLAPSALPKPGPGPGTVGILVGGRIKYVPRPGYVAPDAPAAALAPATGEVTLAKSKRPARPERARASRREKIDPTYLAAARELRDRYLEHVNADGTMLERTAKYDVSKALTSAGSAKSSSAEASRAIEAAPPAVNRRRLPAPRAA